ncbi:MAG: ABC transporter permease [Lachnospiraceae bacterium]|nr:ABC transporter permease [Lachnospiraceae bacterium]
MSKRTMCFVKRNLLEMSKDPLSYIFCLAFPLVMLVIMSIVNASIPEEAGMSLFRIDNLAGGIVIFGQTFVMLFSALNVTKDRSGSFLIRLFVSPMKGGDFTGGYIIPMLIVSFLQSLISFAAAYVIALITGFDLSIAGLLICSVAVLPSALMCTAIGFLFGTLFNEKSAPGICSLIISLGSFLGGIWFDAEGVGGIIEKISKCTPFFYATKLARSVIRLDFGVDTFVVPLAVVTGTAAVLTALSCWVFAGRMRADLA